MENLSAIGARLTPYREALRQPYRVAQLAVLGSYARGDAHSGSDMGILVDFEPGGAAFDNDDEDN